MNLDKFIDLYYKYEHYLIDPQITGYLKEEHLRHLIMSDKSKHS